MLENFSYCPTLYTRVAEMKALTQLPAVTKDVIFPLIVARPWPNAKLLDRTWEKIGNAIGSRPFALDLDRTKRNSDRSRLINTEFDKLFDSRDGFVNYYNAIKKVDKAIPVLRIAGGSALHFEAQAENIDGLDRGVIVRIEYGLVSDTTALIDQVLSRFGDVSIFVDVGWSRDILSREAWASGIIERVSRDHPEIELVIGGSSFPNSFSTVEERGTWRVEERFLYSNLVRRHNAATLIYGDWGSTRPPSPSVPMRNIPRIDLPTGSQWISFRRDQELVDEEDYADIAKRVIADPEWSSNLNIWGTYTIDWTANGEPGAIRGPAAAAAARINIHLHRQAFFGAIDIRGDGDEPFTDD